MPRVKGVSGDSLGFAWHCIDLAASPWCAAAIGKMGSLTPLIRSSKRGGKTSAFYMLSKGHELYGGMSGLVASSTTANDELVAERFFSRKKREPSCTGIVPVAGWLAFRDGSYSR
ncbi:hypothetical protein RMSM_07017 [Rhodopirellula maiorica SM1]|uniref:Uncharacterized protein n=1 Tax=Rhodopirellula maiorica SM1 TaxID=1265738 RepID=M5RAG4_9BACT|nr:hypothetical protein RMSM_07017 [Rhodopirellula maiorica SM1]